MKPAPKSGKDLEQWERWHLHGCGRCGRHGYVAVRWPDGYVCRTCEEKALLTRGTCPGCRADRALPGRTTDGASICGDCAGITRNYLCDRCGYEGPLHTGRLCTRCTLSDLVHGFFDDGTGRINPALSTLADKLIASPNPKSTWMWLRRPHVHNLIGDLATGALPLTHEALHELPNWRSVAHLRDLLMAAGALPMIDKQLLHHQTWLTHRLNELHDDPHQRLLRTFATWHQLPQLRAKAAVKPLTSGSRRAAGEQFQAARIFLTWLDTTGRSLTCCEQADLDAWHAAHGPRQSHTLRTFLRWAMDTGHMPKLRLPVLENSKATPISQQHRLRLIRRAVTHDELPLTTRVAACLVLLYAQPVTRLVRLTVDDLIQDQEELLLKFGDPPTPVPEPFASLLRELADDRPHLNTATNPDARWLFPGRRADQPAHAGTIREHLRLAGFAAGTARVSALRQLVLQAPAPVIANSLGFHHKTTTRIAADAGGSWTHYAPSDHAQ